VNPTNLSDVRCDVPSMAGPDPIAGLLRVLNSSFFDPELRTLRYLGNARSSEEFRAELASYRSHYRRRGGFLRKVLAVRLSGQKLIDLAALTLAPPTDKRREPRQPRADVSNVGSRSFPAISKTKRGAQFTFPYGRGHLYHRHWNWWWPTAKPTSASAVNDAAIPAVSTKRPEATTATVTTPTANVVF
jgi:hypothetical protein